MSAEIPSAQLLRVKSLSASYAAARVLFDVDLHLEAGEAVALMGRNGAGKSTTMKAIMGLLDRRKGRVFFRGADLSQKKPHEIARAGLGYVPEDRRIFTDLTVRENLEIGRQAARGARGATRLVWTPARALEFFPNLAQARDRLASRLSGGEQQMLTLARTLMGDPYAILLDEPSEGVAPIVLDQIADMILALKREGLAILLSEQNLGLARLICDRAYVLEKGQIQFCGTMAALMDDGAARQRYLEV